MYRTVIKERYLATEIRSVFAYLTYTDLEKDLMLISGNLIGSFMKNKSILMMRLKERESLLKDKDFRLDQDPVLNQIMPIFTLYGEKGMIKGSSQRAALLFMASIKGLFYVSFLDDKEEDEIKELVNDFVATFCNGLVNRRKTD